MSVELSFNIADLMSIKLLVKLVDDDCAPTEYAFDDQDIITIGRDSSADLTLFDEDMMVSREHARLEMMGGRVYLVDLGSRNFSSIGGERLTPGQQYPINDGDVFHIANYEVQYTIDSEAPDVDFGVTRFDVGFKNPFHEHVSTFVQAIEAMQKEYDQLPDVRKEVALEEAFSEALTRLEDNPAFQHILKNSATPSSSSVALPPAPPPANIPVQGGSSRYSKFFSNDPTRLDKFMDILMDYVSKQVKVPWQFKYEFIGHTFIPTADSQAVYESDAAGLTNYLFDGSCDGDELDRRFELVRDALNEGLVHQMAILDGYRAAVNAGTKMMIEELDPSGVQEGLESNNPIKKHLAFLSQSEAFVVMKEKHAELAAEDISVIERRTYRPAFIKSYLERTASG